MILNICTKFHENIPDGIKVIERTRFLTKTISKRHNSVINVDGVTVHFLCISSDGVSYLNKVS